MICYYIATKVCSLNHQAIVSIGFEKRTWFARSPVSFLIKPGNITKAFLQKAIELHGTFHGLKITNWL